jgi:23S rRNA pseudouridine2605 synthase
MEERVQKIIAAAGIMSRRAAEQLILEGRVTVNGTAVTELGTKADPERDHIKVDGKLINPSQPRTYLMLNKPVGFVTTMSDPEGRPVVSNLLQGVKARVYPVGRLDYNTEGLLLLTNDGDFAHLITHPRHELPKTYLVKVKGVLTDAQVENLEKGVFLKDGKTAPAKVKKLRKEEANSWVEITIHEGRKRQVRRMIDHTGHSVIKLKRVRIGSLNLGDLPLGTYRHLTADEVEAMKTAAQREQGWEGGRQAAPPARTSSRTTERAPRRHQEREALPEGEQKAFDSWASETARRRKQEREGKKAAPASRKYGAARPAFASREERQGTGERTKRPFARGPKPDRERSASGPAWGRKSGSGDREKGTYSRGPKPDRERSASGPTWGRKTGVGDREKGTYSRGPKPDRERRAPGPAGGREPRPGDRTQRAFPRGPARSGVRKDQRSMWGKRSGPGGQPRTEHPPRKIGQDGERIGSRPPWGRKAGPAGQARTGPGEQLRGTFRRTEGQDRERGSSRYPEGKGASRPPRATPRSGGPTRRGAGPRGTRTSGSRGPRGRRDG